MVVTVSLTGGSEVTEEDTLSPLQAEQSITARSNAAMRFLRKAFIYLPPFVFIVPDADLSWRCNFRLPL